MVQAPHQAPHQAVIVHDVKDQETVKRVEEVEKCMIMVQWVSLLTENMSIDAEFVEEVVNAGFATEEEVINE